MRSSAPFSVVKPIAWPVGKTKLIVALAGAITTPSVGLTKQLLPIAPEAKTWSGTLDQEVQHPDKRAGNDCWNFLEQVQLPQLFFNLSCPLIKGFGTCTKS